MLGKGVGLRGRGVIEKKLSSVRVTHGLRTVNGLLRNSSVRIENLVSKSLTGSSGGVVRYSLCID